MFAPMLLEKSLKGIMIHKSILSKGFVRFREISFLGQYKCPLIFPLLYMIGIIVCCARPFESKRLYCRIIQ